MTALAPAGGAFLVLLFAQALPRGGWDLWSQTLVQLVLALFVLRAGYRAWRGQGGPSAAGLWPLLAPALIASAASAALSRFPHGADRALLNDGAALAFFALCAAAPADRKPFDGRALALGAAAAAGAALVKFDGAGPFPNPNLLAAFLLLFLPSTAAYAAGSASRRERIFWTAALCAEAAALLLTKSFLGFLVGAGLAAAGARAALKSGNRPARAALFAAGAAALLAGAWLFRHDWVRLVAGDGDRLGWWRTAAAIGRAHPWLGAGPGAFGEAYPGFRAEPWALNSLYAHNFLLEWLAERGLLGAGAWLLPLIAAFRSARRAPPETRAAALGLGAFAVFNLFHIGFSFPGLAWAFWALAGHVRAQGAPAPAVSEKLRRALIVVAALLAAAGAWRSAALFRADQCLARAKAAAEEGEIPRAAALLERGLALNPREPELHATVSSLRAFQGDWPAALESARRAAALSPFIARFHYEAGEIALQLGRSDEALESFDRAIRLLPRNPVPWARKARLLESRGEAAEAKRHYAQAAALFAENGADRDPLYGMIRREAEEKAKELP